MIAKARQHALSLLLTLGVAGVLAGLLLFLSTGSRASAGTVLSSTSATIDSVGGTDTTEVILTVAPSDTVNGFAFTLSYDDSIAIPTSITVDGARWNVPVVTCEPIATCQDGTIELAYSQLPADDACLPTAACTLATITWEGQSAGSTMLDLQAVELAGTENNEVGSVSSDPSNDGSLTVEGAGATATNTSATTGTPTATNTTTVTTPTTPGTPATNTPTSTPTLTPSATAVTPTQTGTPPATTPSPTATTADQTPTATGTPETPTPSPSPTPSPTATVTEAVAGAMTPGAGDSPKAPSSGTGFYRPAEGAAGWAQLLGALLVLASALLMAPFMIRAGIGGGRPPRSVDDYFDRLEELGRNGRGKED